MSFPKTCAHGCIDGKLAVADGPEDFRMDFCTCPLGDALMERMASEPVPLRIMSLMSEIGLGNHVLSKMRNTVATKMVWYRGHIMSPTLPSPNLRF